MNFKFKAIKVSRRLATRNKIDLPSRDKGSESFFRSVLGNMKSVYLGRNPTTKSVLELVHSSGNDRICYDHFAFRTFGVNGHGIDSMASIFLNFGYTHRDELRFLAMKLKAYWFSPPAVSSEDGSGINGPLPRVFISGLLVDQMSLGAQVLKDELFVDMFRQKQLYSFLDYISSGFELNFMVAVDFTASNGNPRSPAYLHYIDHSASECLLANCWLLLLISGAAVGPSELPFAAAVLLNAWSVMVSVYCCLDFCSSAYCCCQSLRGC